MQTPSEDSIIRDYTHRRIRIFRYRPKSKRWLRLVVRLFLLIFVLGLVYSGVHLIKYAKEYYSSKQNSQELRSIYYEEKTSAPTITVPPSVSVTPSIPVALATTPAYVATGETVEEFSAEIWLEKIEYPDNPHLIISSRFTKLRRQNNDIVGWLNIDGVLDEAVVQKDNEYYLRRDYRGYHNSNGAVFLEQTCDLRTRPYTIMLYAHNMKSGAMFGVLRNYENITYYRNAPFITFDTVYEDGIYVIFSVASLSLNNDEYDYFDFAKLDSRNIAEREEMIRLLKRRSIFQINIDVIPSDQLLMLVTCTGDSEERRVITARRLRPDETKESLLRIVQKSRKSNVCVR